MIIRIMNMKTKRNLLRIAFFVAFFSIGLSAYSQPIPGDPGTGGHDPVGGGAPLDGGVSILLLLGTAFGGKKVYFAFRKKKTGE